MRARSFRCAALACVLGACALERGGVAGSDPGLADAGGDPVECGGPELCNGLDDDCDPRTPDGAGEPRLGARCDGPDADACRNGRIACLEGALACEDDAPPADAGTCAGDCDDAVDGGAPEHCNGVDDDCDGVIDEAGASGGTLFFRDQDGDGHGAIDDTTTACAMPAGFVATGTDCDDASPDVHPAAAERCNAIDDDCDGVVDDGACEGCTAIARDAQAYLVCAAGRRFEAASEHCESAGYHLAAIEDDAENDWLFERAFPVVDRYWVGVRQAGSNWHRVSDDAEQTYLPWRRGEPNDGGALATEDCVEVGAHRDATWNDADCADELAWVCER